MKILNSCCTFVTWSDDLLYVTLSIFLFCLVRKFLGSIDYKPMDVTMFMG